MSDLPGPPLKKIPGSAHEHYFDCLIKSQYDRSPAKSNFHLNNWASNHEKQVFSCNGFSMIERATVDDVVRESGSTLIAISIILEC